MPDYQAINIRVTALTAETRRGLSDIQLEQFPYALAKTLTEIAKGATEAVRKRTREAFKLHGEFIPRGVSFTSAKKSDIRATGEGTTAVFTKPLISGFMPIHEEGGVRTPNSGGEGSDRGRALSQPGQTLLTKAYRTGTGRVRKRWKVSTLLQGYIGKRRGVSLTGGLTRTTRGGRKGQPFVIRSKGSDVPIVVRRAGVKRYPLELLYIFSKRARYKPSWRFEQTVADVVDRRFQSRLERNLKLAVAKAH
jgi:hypothetical protein